MYVWCLFQSEFILILVNSDVPLCTSLLFGLFNRTHKQVNSATALLLRSKYTRIAKANKPFYANIRVSFLQVMRYLPLRLLQTPQYGGIGKWVEHFIITVNSRTVKISKMYKKTHLNSSAKSKFISLKKKRNISIEAGNKPAWCNTLGYESSQSSAYYILDYFLFCKRSWNSKNNFPKTFFLKKINGNF